MLGSDVRTTLGVPNSYVDRENNAFMTNFGWLIGGLLRTCRPGHIVEIGSEEGETSRWLAGVASEIGARLHVVDPAFDAATSFGPGTTPYAMKSSEFLHGPVRAGAWVLDGDHNYATLTLELDGILGRTEEGRPLIVFLHDVGWPWARRDMFYDPADVTGECLPGHEPRLEGGRPTRRANLSRGGPSVRVEEGGDGNGVLTAVEDFIERNPGRFGYHQVTGFFGLGILFEIATLPEGAAAFLSETMQAHSAMHSLLSALEANRLRLLQSHFDMADEIVRLGAVLDRIKRFPPVRALAWARGLVKPSAGNAASG